MSLLEALVALVILGLAGVGYLDAFQGTARSSGDAQAWIQAVADAEAGMEEAKLGEVSRSATRTIDVRPWPASPSIDLVTVTVLLPDGGSFVLRRLERAR